MQPVSGKSSVETFCSLSVARRSDKRNPQTSHMAMRMIKFLHTLSATREQQQAGCSTSTHIGIRYVSDRYHMHPSCIQDMYVPLQQ